MAEAYNTATQTKNIMWLVCIYDDFWSSRNQKFSPAQFILLIFSRQTLERQRIPNFGTNVLVETTLVDEKMCFVRRGIASKIIKLVYFNEIYPKETVESSVYSSGPIQLNILFKSTIFIINHIFHIIISICTLHRPTNIFIKWIGSFKLELSFIFV